MMGKNRLHGREKTDGPEAWEEPHKRFRTATAGVTAAMGPATARDDETLNCTPHTLSTG